MDVLHNLLVEVDGFEVLVVEASEAILDAKDLVRRYAVIFKSEHNVLDDIIQPGTQPTTGHHCCCHLQSKLRLRQGLGTELCSHCFWTNLVFQVSAMESTYVPAGVSLHTMMLFCAYLTANRFLWTKSVQ